LRGAVPIILATFPMLAGLERANSIFNIVFFVALTSVLLQGTTVPLVARWTGTQSPVVLRRVFPLELTPTEGSDSELVEIHVSPGSSADGKRIVDLRLLPGALIVLMSRNNQFVVPGGGTIIHAGDTVMVLAHRDRLASIRAGLESRGGDPGSAPVAG
ncbi:MAG: TrkA C-terminal domain-containing protein, partial [Terriglobales bacterium]